MLLCQFYYIKLLGGIHGITLVENVKELKHLVQKFRRGAHNNTNINTDSNVNKSEIIIPIVSTICSLRIGNRLMYLGRERGGEGT